MSPVRRTWVPPQSSVEKSPKRSTRTSVAVLLAEERHGAAGDGLVVFHDAGLALGVGADLGVDQALDLGELLRLDGLVVGEVEAQPVRRDERALLRDVGAEHAAQRGVQEVRGGVVEHGGGARGGVDLGGDLARRR